MKVIFRQSGGVAGLVRGCALNTRSGSAGESARLLEILETSGLLESPGRQSEPSDRGRDLIQYEIRIESDPPDTTSIEVTFDDSTLPEEARTLVQFLKSRAKPIPLD